MMKNRMMILKKLKSEKGSLLLISYFVIVLLLGLGAIFMQVSANEVLIAERQKLTAQAFHIAEAGIEQALYELRQDFVNDPTPSWSDGDINGITVIPDNNNFYTLYNPADTAFNDGSYRVEIKNVAGGRDAWAQSTGMIKGISHTLQVYVRMVDVSPWGNAIFAGAGAAGAMVNGNVDIRGSVHILGDNLNAGDIAIDMGGTAQLVGNNYSTLDPTLAAKIPALATVTYNGEVVETLNAELRVKKGLVALSGSAAVGEVDVPGNAYKETVDGVYVTDGWDGNQGSANVSSDNGVTNAYDLGDAVIFPSLSDPYPGYASYQSYLYNNGLVLTNELNNVSAGSTFSYSDANGSITMDGNGNMTVSGIVYIDGNNDVIVGGKNAINYTGTGVLLVTGDVTINTNLVTSGNNSFPNNILGIMTPNDMHLGTTAQLDIMGLFYAENSVIVQKQTDILGTIVSNYFDMGSQVPAIFQVPEVQNNMPPGMIGGGATWYLIVAWIKT